MKLINKYLQCWNINSIKGTRNNPIQVLELFATVWIMPTNIYIDHTYGLLVEYIHRTSHCGRF
jgi:hypothetical protein